MKYTVTDSIHGIPISNFRGLKEQDSFTSVEVFTLLQELEVQSAL